MSQASLQPRRDHPAPHYPSQQQQPAQTFNSPPSYSHPISQPFPSSTSQGLAPGPPPSLPDINSISNSNSNSNMNNGMPNMNHLLGMNGGMNNGMNNGMNGNMHGGMNGMNGMPNMGSMGGMSMSGVAPHPIALPQHLQQQQHQIQNVRDLHGTSFRKGDKIFSLTVRQQPIRARMCGFGDKDRRPITPPPCIQLTVCDANTGKEIDPSEIDSSYFILTVDLWDQTGASEVNLVRHSNSSPAVSISAATTVPYPPPPDRQFLGVLSPAHLHGYYSAIGDEKTAQNALYIQQQHGPPMYQQPHQMQHYGGGYGHQQIHPFAMSHQQASTIPLPIVPTPTAGMFTRNLIGSLSVNAFKLQDPEGTVGFWFVLQDLSVRTEGMFRLKMNFVDVANPDGQGTLNRGKAPVLATCYSEPFQVYSAKKFPGVIESTELSKCFAGQGIKIPIRKDGPKVPNQAEYDNDD